MSKKTDDYLKKQDRADVIIFIAFILAIMFCASCRKETKVCWTCTHADGRPLPLAPCQPKPPVIYNADGSILPIKCTSK